MTAVALTPTTIRPVRAGWFTQAGPGARGAG